ncbi:MAG: glutathione S-transferase family protein [Rhizomicrobium sp.]|nr:glutathione S-transferase family protein [Rhizomicrobium sp.]
MITLHGSFPAFGLPHASPFVMKTEVQLKMAEIPYRLERGFPADGPKQKIPYIVEADHKIGDSTFIRDHIEKAYGIDLDRGLTPDMRARSWAIERMLEDHLYWAIVYFRWMEEANFAAGPAHFFDTLPSELREEARIEARRAVACNLLGHGLGRHSQEEVADLGCRSMAALATLLGNKAYLMGPAMAAVDATAFAMIAAATAPIFTSPLKDFTLRCANLMAYQKRLMREFYPCHAARQAA